MHLELHIIKIKFVFTKKFSFCENQFLILASNKEPWKIHVENIFRDNPEIKIKQLQTSHKMKGKPGSTFT